MKKSLSALVCCLLILPAIAQKKLDIYDQKIRAKDLIGVDEFGPLQVGGYKTYPFNPPVVVSTLNEKLGQYYAAVKNGYANTESLLDLLRTSESPIAQKILFQYYQESAIPGILNSDDYKKNEQFETFAKAFREAKDNAVRQDLLNANFDIKRQLYGTIFEVYRPQIAINTQYINKKNFELGISAKYVQQVSKIMHIDASVEAKIKTAVEQTVKMNGGIYHEVRLNKNLITIAGDVFKYYYEHADEFNQYHDLFAIGLRDYFQNPNVSVIVGYSVLEADFTVEFKREVEPKLSAILGAELGTKDKPAAPDIAAKVTAAIDSDPSRSGAAVVSRAFYIIKYIYSDKLEVGAGASGN